MSESTAWHFLERTRARTTEYPLTSYFPFHLNHLTDTILKPPCCGIYYYLFIFYHTWIIELPNKETKGLIFIIRLKALELDRLCYIVPVNNCAISLAMLYLSCSYTQTCPPGQSTYAMAHSSLFLFSLLHDLNPRHQTWELKHHLPFFSPALCFRHLY